MEVFDALAPERLQPYEDATSGRHLRGHSVRVG